MNQPSPHLFPRRILGASVIRASAALIAFALLSPFARAERAVTELQPSEVTAFIQQHSKVVVQFTSPDPKCGYCVGADKLFADGVARSGLDGWKYARVQWPRWNHGPEFGAPVVMMGIPDHQVFEAGVYKGSGGGREKDAATLMAKLEAVSQGKSAPAAAPAAPRDPAEVKEKVREGLRYYALRKELGGTIHDCERNHHGNKSVYAKQLSGWVDAHAAELKLGTQAMFATMIDKTVPYESIMQDHASDVRARLSREFGIKEGVAATLEQCERLASRLGDF